MLDFEVPLEMKIIYLRRRVEEFQTLEEELTKGQFDLAQKVGHQVKGNAATFHLPLFSDLARQLEERAKAQDQAEARRISIEMKTLAEKLLKELA